MAASDRLALEGGAPARVAELPSWPVFGADEERALVALLRSGAWFAGMSGADDGTACSALERKLEAHIGSGEVVVVTNGTAALEVALRASGIGPGDEVIVPAYTFFATASAAAQLGAVPVIVDVRERDLNIDPDAIEAAVTARTRAVVPVHIGGQVADMEAILAIADRADLVVIEDAAHALGAVRHGRSAGTFATAGTFSFQHAKTVSGGEGGAIVASDEDVVRRCRSLRTGGRVDPEDPYVHGLLGWNDRMTEWQATVIAAQLDRADEQRSRRTAAAAYLRSALAEARGLTPRAPEPSTQVHNQYYFTVLLPAASRPETKEFALAALRAEGLPVSGGYPTPLGDNPVFDRVPARIEDCPVARSLCARVINLPHHVLLADDRVLDEVAHAFIKVGAAVTAGRGAV